MKHTIYLLSFFFLILYGCSSEGSYEFRNPDELDWAYRVYTYKEVDRPATWSSFKVKAGLSAGMKKYLLSISDQELGAYVHEIRDDSLFQDWGIYEKNGGKEDTLFYAQLSPVLSLIGDYGKEVWVISSAKCRWKKSWKLRAFDIRPFTGLSYYSTLYGPDHNENDITSNMIMDIQIDASEIMTYKSYGFHGDLEYRSAEKRHQIYRTASNLFTPEGQHQESLKKLMKEGWETRSRGNIFPDLNP
ncbi:MAG: hypothetical protein AAFR87_20505 [Bacteroidota bacterium]